MTAAAQVQLFRGAATPAPIVERELVRTVLERLNVPSHVRPGATAWRVGRGRARCEHCNGSGFLPFTYPATHAADERCPRCDFGRSAPECWVAEQAVVAEVLVSITRRGSELRVVWADGVAELAVFAFTTQRDAALAADARPPAASAAPTTTQKRRARR